MARGLVLVERDEAGPDVRHPLADVSAELELAIILQGPRSRERDLRPRAREPGHGDGRSEKLGRELETPLVRTRLPEQIPRRGDALREGAERLDAARDQTHREEGHAERRAQRGLPGALAVSLGHARARIFHVSLDHDRGRDPRGVAESRLRASDARYVN